MFHHLAGLLSRHFCQYPINPGRTRQWVEQHKSTSIQPRFASGWATLYTIRQMANTMLRELDPGERRRKISFQILKKSIREIRPIELKVHIVLSFKVGNVEVLISFRRKFKISVNTVYKKSCPNMAPCLLGSVPRRHGGPGEQQVPHDDVLGCPRLIPTAGERVRRSCRGQFNRKISS